MMKGTAYGVMMINYFKSGDHCLRPAHICFLKLFLSEKLVCICVCTLPLRLLITSDMTWTSYDWLNKLYNIYIAAVVIINIYIAAVVIINIYIAAVGVILALNAT